MSTSTFVGNSDGLVTGLCPAPPPPPPPPPVPGQVPAMRINTVETPTTKRPQIPSNDVYEPPAAIQNAMLTKDKKPFTYTPGMGGKLDLSQIRSPRMARRVAKNANDEGIEGPPKSALEPKPTPPPNTGASLFVQPQVAIPVFPTNVPVQPTVNRTPANKTPPMSPANRTQPTTPEKQQESPKLVGAKVTPTITIQPNTPESVPSTPTQVTLAKAPTPWLQNKNKPQEELPEWAKRSSNVARQQSSSSSSPDSPTSPPIYTPSIQQQTQQQQPPQAQQRPQQIQQPQLYQYQQQQQPQQFNQQQKRPFSSPSVTQQVNAPAQPQERVIPIRIEDRPSVFDVKPEPGHHQFKQPSPHHQQRWGQQPQNQNQNQAQNQIQNQVPQQSSGGAYIIPIMIEGSDKKPATGAATSNSPYSQPIIRNNLPNVENPNVKVMTQRIIPVQVQQSDSGPVQSRSFRVLQKITDTDSSNDADTEQMRKLQLSEDDRILMNKFKEQIDNESSLHHEEDPRYRGGAIPSRAFRFLQTMTESGDAPAPVNTTQRPPSAINKKQNRNSKTFEETQANLPPSEQQVPEPKKYMGSAIPSRSFRILQAMTAPESVATQENRQADYHCQTENNVPGNQQGVFLSPCPPPFWSPDNGWWGYYPLPYPGAANDSYPYHPDNTAYLYFPIYNHQPNHPPYPQYDPTTNDKMNAYANVYPPYVVPAPPQSNNNNCSHNCQQAGRTGENPVLAKIHPTTNVTDIPENIQEHNLGGNRGHESRIIGENDDTKDQPQWEKGNSVSRTASNSSKDSDCTTAMNITDEEEIPDEIVISEINEDDQCPERPETKPCPNGSLNVNVPNYTYIDTSDSSDSTDSESQSDNESIVESFKSDSGDSSTSSSDSDDSDSYLAYSTRLNAHGRSGNDDERNSSGNGSSKESCNEEENSESSDKNNSDSDNVDEQEQELEKTEIGTFPHQLSVIYEDVEQPEPESPRPQERRGVKGWNGTPFEATDDPPDDSDAPTVSVSLPLRFKFSVSENNEDVTMVIVGDSTIKPERGYNWEESRRSKTQESLKSHSERTAEVSANFVVKKQSVNAKRKPKDLCNERTKDETVECKAKENGDPVVPHVNFTLRKIPTRFGKINCGETVETEFTIRRKTSVKREDDRTNKVHEERANVKINDDSASRESKGSNSVYVAKETGSETRDFNRNVLKPEVIVSECNWTDESSQRNERPLDKFQNADTKVERVDDTRENSDDSKRSKNEEDAEEKTGKRSKHLLSVQNSREETDDEDSGVTSDMSRMISEADTDSECTSSKNMRKYQRTQTHSRLFRLLNDDSIVPESAEKSNESSSTTKEYLSLPLNSNNFNYDENYCSNYSSGVTSPECSPISEQSWKKLHDADSAAIPDQNGDVFRQGHPLTRSQDRVSCKEDPYYQAWKTSRSPAQSLDHDVVPSLAFKVLESRRPLWSYKVQMQRITEQGRASPSETWHC
ncbi:hypothetical protein QLX08_004601 [Tetragonisca angustula]|uniref:Uncharacterized protein n=1 Tax=Tetragonisca angustula TaxID=166442 RepID=A0AAW1A1G8_9HYME